MFSQKETKINLNDLSCFLCHCHELRMRTLHLIFIKSLLTIFVLYLRVFTGYLAKIQPYESQFVFDKSLTGLTACLSLPPCLLTVRLLLHPQQSNQFQGKFFMQRALKRLLWLLSIACFATADFICRNGFFAASSDSLMCFSNLVFSKLCLAYICIYWCISGM